MSGCTIVEVLARRATDAPDALAFDIGGHSITFGQLFESARILAGRLAHLGLQPGDRCALVLPTGHDFIGLVYAIQMAGGTPVAIDPAAPAALRARRLRMLAPAIVVAPDVAAVQPGPYTVSSPSVLRHAGGSDPVRRAVSPEDLAYLQLTSGSTGDSRAAAITHRALMAGLEGLRERFDLTPSDVMAGWSPMHYTPGLVRYVFATVHAGCQTHLIPPSAMDLGRWIDLLARTGATVTSAPDFAYRLAARTAGPGATLRALRVATNGGEQVRASTIEAFERAFGLSNVVQPAYGLAEATLIVASGAPGDAVVVDAAGSVSCGPPLAGVEVRTIAADGRICSSGEEGEIQVRGTALFEGYHGDAAQTAAVLRGGWLCTGDVGAIDARGSLYPRARARALIKRAGVGLAPREIEEPIEAFAEVVGAAAIGVPRAGRSTDDLVLVVETAADVRLCGAGMVQRVTRAVIEAVGMAPSEVIVVPPASIPRTASGKILRLELSQRLTDAEFLARAFVSR